MTEMLRIINRIIYNIKNNYATKTYVDNKLQEIEQDLSEV